jgi:ABC-2 type transport system permease protein
VHALKAFGYETYYLGLRTTRRFLRVPANWISIIFFPLIQLLVFSQLYKDIVALPAFDGSSYLAYLAPGQIVFASFMAVAWASYGLLVEYRSGYLDKLRASPIARWSILAGEMVPLFFQAAAMAGILLLVSLLLGATLVTGVGGFAIILLLSGVFGIAFAGVSFVPALITKSEQATSALSLLMFPIIFIRELPDRGHSQSDGHRLRLERDRQCAARDGDCRRALADRHDPGVPAAGPLSLGTSG